MRMAHVCSMLLLAAVVSQGTAAEYWKPVGVHATLLGGGLYGFGMKAKTSSGVAFDAGVQYLPEFMWKVATDEEETGPSINFYGQIEYYLTKSEMQPYLLFRIGNDDFAYQMLALGGGIEYFLSDKMAVMGELGLVYRPRASYVEDRVHNSTGSRVDVLPIAPLLRVGISFY